MTKIHRVVVMVEDLNNPSLLLVGERMPRVEFGTVMSVETREVEWTDEHPLNYKATQAAAFEELFRG